MAPGQVANIGNDATTHSIALLDDRKDARESVARGLTGVMPEGWRIIEVPLLDRVDQYWPWLESRDVRVLLLDQLLNENPAESGQSVQYKGNQVADAIRNVERDFPIFVVTRATEDADLAGSKGTVEDVIDRAKLLEHAKMYIERITRAGRKFIETHAESLARLSQLAAKAATGQADAAELRELDGLRAGLALESVQANDVDNKLNNIEAKLSNMEKLGADLLAAIQSNEPKDKVTGPRKGQVPAKKRRSSR